MAVTKIQRMQIPVFPVRQQLTVLLLVLFSCAEAAAWPVTTGQPEAAEPRQAAEAISAEEFVPEEPIDECDWYLEDQPVQEQSQEVLRSWSCHTFRWFDSLWGKEQDFKEDQVNGWATTGIEYRDFDGFDPRFRIKVRAPLPNLNDRWDVIFGRVDEDSYISDTEAVDSVFTNPVLGGRSDNESWLLGLGHRRGKRRSGWDWSVGVRLRFPPEPYAKVSWLYRQRLTENSDMRFRQTLFWRSEEGFGTTSRIDTAWAINPSDVMRWEGIARFSEETKGMDWYFGQTWYHLLENGSAYSLLGFVKGETDAEVEIDDAGLILVWRFPFTRDYMYLSMGPSLTWPRRKLTQERKANLGFGIWIEIEFGDWKY